MKLLRKFGSVFDYIIDYAFYLGGVIVVFETITIVASSMGAYLFNRPIEWVVSISEFGLLYIAFLAGAWLLKKEKHITADIIINQFSLRTQAIARFINSILGIIICLLLTVFGALVTLDHYQRGVIDIFKMENFQKYMALIIIPIGALMLTIQFCRRTYGAWRVVSNPEAALVKDAEAETH